jgi:diketogulonate reductase-like aldo/keto reductase
MTNAQVLIRWAVQRNYIAVPRSAAKYKIEKQNIYENSWNGISKFILSEEEMSILNNLDEKYPVGRLGVTDGWTEQQIKNGHWDPTTAPLTV